MLLSFKKMKVDDDCPMRSAVIAIWVKQPQQKFMKRRKTQGYETVYVLYKTCHHTHFKMGKPIEKIEKYIAKRKKIKQTVQR